MYKVAEIAKELGKSKTAVYNNLKQLKSELKPYEKRLNGVVCYDREGFRVIAKSFGIEIKLEKDVENNLNLGLSESSKLLILAKEETIKLLESQLKEKDKQLEQLMKQNEQAQVLLLNEQREKQMLLEYKENIESTPKKTFWSKIFYSNK